MPPALSHPDEVNDSYSLSNHKTVNALNRAKCAYSTQSSKALNHTQFNSNWHMKSPTENYFESRVKKPPKKYMIAFSLS